MTPWWDVRVRAELAAALDPSLRASAAHALRTQAAKSIRALRAQGAVWPNALADLADGCLQRARGSTTEALTSIAGAETGFSSVAMHLYATVARRRKGQWIGGDAGRTMIAECDQWLQDHGIVNPSKMAWMIAPAPQSWRGESNEH